MWPSTSIKLLIADDHQLVREMLVMLMRAYPDFAVQTAESLPGALAAIQEAEGFDLVLLDVNMPGMSGLAGVGQSVRANPGGAVVLLSGALRHGFVTDAIALGARGYIPKSLPARDFVDALYRILGGETYVPHANHTDVPPPEGPEMAQLTGQEHRVLALLCEGLPNKAIARELGLTEVTVKAHMRSLCAKIGARNRTEAALIAQNPSL